MRLLDIAVECSEARICTEDTMAAECETSSKAYVIMGLEFIDFNVSASV